MYFSSPVLSEILSLAAGGLVDGAVADGRAVLIDPAVQHSDILQTQTERGLHGTLLLHLPLTKAS